MPRLWLFLLTCVLNGALTFAGSVLGNAFGGRGLFMGALVGGFIGVTLAAQIGRGRLFEAARFGRVVAGGGIGFGVAALIATANLHTPVIPLLSIGLVGAGAVAGSLAPRPRAT